MNKSFYDNEGYRERLAGLANLIKNTHQYSSGVNRSGTSRFSSGEAQTAFGDPRHTESVGRHGTGYGSGRF